MLRHSRDVAAMLESYAKNADGIFGSKTEAAVIKWQKDHPVCGKPDGIIGPKTWASILN